MTKKHFLLLTLILFVLAACQPTTPTTPAAQPQTLTIMTHDSFSVSEELVRKFEAENNATLVFIQGGDAGSALNRLILTSVDTQTPEADVFYGLDNTFLSRALDQDLFEAYQPASLSAIPAEFKLDPTFKVVPIDYGDVCINYDKAWFAENNLELPASLQDLAKPEYSGLLVVENPATSSPGLAFMMATIAEFGETSWLEWWQAMKDNKVVVVSDWETAYYTNFSGSSGKGPQPMVVSYASSPAAELIYAETELSESPTASLVNPGMCWRQVEFAGILKNTPNRALAEKFIDFLLSKEFQEDVPMQMFVFPVLPEAILPEGFVLASQTPETVSSLDPALIAANRDIWVNDWTNLMLK
ncbi:MAG TPA: thiamine ABC transporter substrate-binding protein [Anaerolineaceae bacterium]|nr:thiamine ABC transporter substrate-binding protein [Anaerolineaceae bacterium]